MLWLPTLTPHRDAFLHHLWSGVAQYSVYELPQDKRKVRDQGRGGRASHLDILGIWPFQACSLSFLGSGQWSAVHRPNMHSLPTTWRARDSTSQDSGYPHGKRHRAQTHAFRVIGPWNVQYGLWLGHHTAGSSAKSIQTLMLPASVVCCI